LKQVLFVVPYNQLFPPRNGGMLRNYFLCFELSKYYKVTLLTFQHAEEFIDKKEGYQWNTDIEVVSIPVPAVKKKGLLKIINAVKGRIYQRNLFRSTGDYHLYGYPCLKKLLKSKKFHSVIFAHATSLELSYSVAKYSPGTVVILDAHNVDHFLFKQEKNMLLPANQKQYQRLKHLESNLSKDADFFLACSNHDKTILEEINEQKIKGFVIPNGADTYKNLFQKEKTGTGKRLLFCGSLDYEPNQDGLKWFYGEIWPLVKAVEPDIRFVVIGRNGNNEIYQPLKIDPSIDFIGDVSEVQSYYYQCSLSVVPLRKGSGTRLKILEAMSLGTPVVSTNIGAEGIDCTNGKDILIANDPASFADAILRLMNDKGKADFIRKKARNLIDSHYSWEILGKELANVLDTINQTH
jgi:polysaccharide biosynthesis protein PslH